MLVSWCFFTITLIIIFSTFPKHTFINESCFAQLPPLPIALQRQRCIKAQFCGPHTLFICQTNPDAEFGKAVWG